jgi:hypothetical protein
MKKETSKSELVVLVNKSELQSGTRELLITSFEPLFLQAKEWREKAEALVVTDATQVSEMKQAREGRLALKSIRVEADKKRKELKEDSTRYNNAVQGIYNTIQALIVPIEQHLEKQEKFAEIAEDNRKKALHDSRLLALREYNFQYDTGFHLGDMSEESYQSLLDGCKIANEKRIAEEKRIEEEKIAAEKAMREKAEAQRIENERLKKEAADQQIRLAKEREQAEAQRKEIEEKARKEREEIARLAKIESEKQAAIIKAERAKREKAELELLAKKQHEAQQAEALEKQQKADQKAAKKLAAAPDKDKLGILALQLEKIFYPDDVKTDEAKKIVADTKALINKVINHVKTKTNEL